MSSAPDPSSEATRARWRRPPAVHQTGAAYVGDHTHRDLRGGTLRAAVFGVSDGLVSNVSLVLGTAGAHPGAGVIRLAGLAGLLGGSFSMAAGEYISMQAQREAFQRELEVERREIDRHPKGEQRELELIYRERGIAPELAEQLADHMMADPERALATHAREELGIDPEALGSPLGAAGSSFATFALGAVVPLVPFLTGSAGNGAILLAVLLAGIGAIAVGGVLSRFTERSLVFSALRQLGLCAVAGAVTFGIGSIIGVSAS